MSTKRMAMHIGGHVGNKKDVQVHFRGQMLIANVHVYFHQHLLSPERLSKMWRQAYQEMRRYMGYRSQLNLQLPSLF
jgi:hypothetical protein